MNTIDKISRDSKIVVNSVKDTITKNMTNAVLNRNLDLSEKQLSEILKIVEMSSEEGYQRSVPVFQNTIKKHFST